MEKWAEAKTAAESMALPECAEEQVPASLRWNARIGGGGRKVQKAPLILANGWVRRDKFAS
jgi:hypothetical protein